MGTKRLVAKMGEYGVDLDKVLDRFIYDEELYCTCLESFMADANFNSLRRGVNARDYAMAFTAAHTIKGVAGNLGLAPLYDCVCELVESLRAKDYDELDAQYEAVDAQYQLIKKIVDENLE